MSQQPFALQQGTASPWIHVQSADDEAREYYPNQHPRLPHPESSSLYRAVDPEAACQYHPQFTNIDFASVTNYPPLSQGYHQPLVVPFVAPPPSSPIQIPISRNTPVELSPFSSQSTSASTSSSTGAASPDVCRQSQPQFNEQTQQWSCGGCKRIFSDKYGTERHIATVGLKVTCRYCGSRVSVHEFSRRRHFRRESCRKQGIQRGFLTRNEEDAFIEDP